MRFFALLFALGASVSAEVMMDPVTLSVDINQLYCSCPMGSARETFFGVAETCSQDGYPGDVPGHSTCIASYLGLFADPCNQYLSKENVLGIFGQGLGDDEESAALEQCWNQGNFAPAPEATAQFHFASDLDFNVQDASLGMFYECVDQIHRWACQRFVENSLNSCQPVLAY